MNRANILILALLSAAMAAPAAAAQEESPKGGEAYYWLHPKLGLVKVDRATNAMVRSQESAGREQFELWLDPKGNYRLVKRPDR